LTQATAIADAGRMARRLVGIPAGGTRAAAILD